MSWLFSQALVEEYLEDTSLDGEQSVPLSGNNTQLAYCAPDKMTAFSRLSQFGMMYKPLTESRGEELLMSYLAGFPAKTSQPQGGGGIDGERSGMWREMARIIREVRPRHVFVENSPMLTSRGLGRVLGDLASMGFDAEWGVLGHDRFGGQHRRDRIWIVGYADKRTFQSLGKRQSKNIDKWKKKKRGEGWIDFLVGHDGTTPPSWRIRGKENDPRPIMWRSGDGMANGVDRIAAIGNGQVPRVAAAAWRILSAP
jgi:DNA (cytosine-5)-methyltransferase 1